jgi:hypothetical protein
MGTTGRRRAVITSAAALVMVSVGLLAGTASSVAEKPATTQASVSTVPVAPTTTTAPPAATTTTTTTTTMPVAPVAPTTTSTTVPANAPAPQSTSTTAEPSGYGCAAALAYLQANANPEFTFACPGYADGREAMTCVNIAGLCAGEHLVAIADPCPAAYMNEAYNSNSWSDSLGEFTRPIDPYGTC